MALRTLFQFLALISLSAHTLAQHCSFPTPDPSAVAKALNTSTGNPSNCPRPNSTFLQQFQIIDTYYKPGGPIPFLQGDESPLDCLEYTALVEYAQELDALLVNIEHRYFGLSCPFGLNYSNTATWPVSSLKYLTWQNVLADSVYFLDWVKTSAYPGAGEIIAASGPYTFGWGTYANTIYYDTSIELATKIKQAMLDFRGMMAAGNFSGMQEAPHLCTPPNAMDQVDAIAWYIQYDYVRTLQQNIALLKYPFNRLVNATLPLNDSLAILGVAIEIYNELSGVSACLDWAASPYPIVDPFLYMRCTYVPFPDPYSTADSIWGANLPDYSEAYLLDPYCKAIFNITSVNGGLALQRKLGIDPGMLRATERLLFTEGLLDPVTFFEPKLEPSHSRNGSRVLYIDGAAHTADILAANATDSQGLMNARVITLNMLKEWLGYQS